MYQDDRGEDARQLWAAKRPARGRGGRPAVEGILPKSPGRSGSEPLPWPPGDRMARWHPGPEPAPPGRDHLTPGLLISPTVRNEERQGVAVPLAAVRRRSPPATLRGGGMAPCPGHA